MSSVTVEHYLARKGLAGYLARHRLGEGLQCVNMDMVRLGAHGSERKVSFRDRDLHTAWQEVKRAGDVNLEASFELYMQANATRGDVWEFLEYGGSPVVCPL